VSCEEQERLEVHGLLPNVRFIWGDFFFEGNVRGQVAQWWAVDSVDDSLTEILYVHCDAEQLSSAEVGSEPAIACREAASEQCRDAFRYYVPMLTQWRRIPYDDPNLPDHYMPEGWKEPEARRIFARTHRLIASLAGRHARRVIRTNLPHGVM